MDLEEIKKFIKSKNDKIIVVEKGKPIFVIASIDYFKDNPDSLKSASLVDDKTGKKIDKSPDELSIDDLPF